MWAPPPTPTAPTGTIDGTCRGPDSPGAIPEGPNCWQARGAGWPVSSDGPGGRNKIACAEFSGDVLREPAMRSLWKPRLRIRSLLALIAGIALLLAFVRPSTRAIGARDTTLMSPELDIDPRGGMLRIHGGVRVINPMNDGRDHDASVRLTVTEPESGLELYSEDLTRMD